MFDHPTREYWRMEVDGPNVSCNSKPDSDLIEVRWFRLDLGDFDEVFKIASLSSKQPLNHENLNALQAGAWNCLAVVAIVKKKIVGYMIYRIRKSNFRIERFGVAPGARRRKIGTTLLQWLQNKSKKRQNGSKEITQKEILIVVRSDNTIALTFFINFGFVLIAIIEEHFRDTSEDGHILSYTLPKPEP